MNAAESKGPEIVESMLVIHQPNYPPLPAIWAESCHCTFFKKKFGKERKKKHGHDGTKNSESHLEAQGAKPPNEVESGDQSSVAYRQKQSMTKFKIAKSKI